MAGPSQSERDSLRKQGKAMPPAGGGKGGRYYIRNRTDLQHAIHAVGRGSGDHSKIIAFIKRRAKALGLTSMIPKNW